MYIYVKGIPAERLCLESSFDSKQPKLKQKLVLHLDISTYKSCVLHLDVFAYSVKKRLCCTWTCLSTRACPLPLWFRGGDTLACEREGGGVQFGRGDRHCGTLGTL
jgi:hypothetical protein